MSGASFKRVYLSFQAYDIKTFLRSIHRVYNCALQVKDLKVGKVISMPKKVKKFTVLRSPFVHKNARDQSQLVKHRRLLLIEGETKTVNKFVKFLNEILPHDLACKVTERQYFNASKFYNFTLPSNLDERRYSTLGINNNNEVYLKSKKVFTKDEFESAEKSGFFEKNNAKIIN
eukprot:TRINITY_DN16787_c0_g1_i1.p1 TRINITY_DN16787_c0_g1~~TRINITY_DN16787_c0_g1_i1.p1  ORF type:complete len:187 (-),score=32.74 TRINITY_DN16787_c0_g1_i1:141-662(-)